MPTGTITRRLALAASAAAGGLATAAFFLLLRPNGGGDDLTGGGFTALREWPQDVYPLVNDKGRDDNELKHGVFSPAG
jgi:hypothetical protein